MTPEQVVQRVLAEHAVGQAVVVEATPNAAHNFEAKDTKSF